MTIQKLINQIKKFKFPKPKNKLLIIAKYFNKTIKSKSPKIYKYLLKMSIKMITTFAEKLIIKILQIF